MTDLNQGIARFPYYHQLDFPLIEIQKLWLTQCCNTSAM